MVCRRSCPHPTIPASTMARIVSGSIAFWAGAPLLFAGAAFLNTLVEAVLMSNLLRNADADDGLQQAPQLSSSSNHAARPWLVPPSVIIRISHSCGVSPKTRNFLPGADVLASSWRGRDRMRVRLQEGAT